MNKRNLPDLVLWAAAVASVTFAVTVLALHIGFVRVVSGSMQPSIGIGDVAVVREVPVTQLHVGDVAILPLPEDSANQYLHRIQRITLEDGGVVLQTKGDANTTSDQWQLRVTSKEVPVMFALLPVASLSNFLMTGSNRNLILLGLLLLALLEILRASRHLLKGHQGAPKPPLRPAH